MIGLVPVLILYSCLSNPNFQEISKILFTSINFAGSDKINRPNYAHGTLDFYQKLLLSLYAFDVLMRLTLNTYHCSFGYKDI
jgi:hypothetical protein